MFRRVAIALTVAFLAAPSYAYVVNNLGDSIDQTPGDNICADAALNCTLLAAIMEANAHPGPDPITFSVAGTISPASPYPAIVEQTNIDGTTAPGYAGTPVVIIDGITMVPIAFDFAATADNSSLIGLQVMGFSDTAVRVASDNTIIRSNILGYLGLGNANGDGAQISGANNVIGGSAAGQRNIIVNNDFNGLVIQGSGHDVFGNFIGTDGSQPAGNGEAGILVTGAATNIDIGSTVAGTRNVISGNGFEGINLDNGSNVTIDNNYIGVDAAGTTAISNGDDGIFIRSSNNRVGSSAAGNVISGNFGDGIDITEAVSNIVVEGNIIGPDATGLAGVGNFGFGVSAIIADNITVGAIAPLEGNLISFNGLSGVAFVDVSNSSVIGNIVGLHANGDGILGNGFEGIAIISSTGITVGAPNGRNIVSGNSLGGITVADSSNVIVQNNYVGTDITGLLGRGNLDTGILLAAATTTTVRNNVVGDNDWHGIELTIGANGNTVHSNIVGVSANLATPLGNSVDGINVCDSAFNNVVGSVALGGNTIAHNDENGIGVENTALLDNTWEGNAIYDNTLLGIDLNVTDTTPTWNDPLDADTGPNNLQNYPTITSAISSPASSQINGTINTTPLTLVNLHFYSNAAADPSGFGEGEVYVGTTSVTTDGAGNASFTFNGPAIAVGRVVTATATGPDGTSEFSGATGVQPAPTVQFSLATYPAGEAAGTATITVTRTGALGGTSTVQYATSNGTAMQPGDYTTAGGTLTFLPGDDTETFNVAIINDTLDEPLETINLTLFSPNLATLGAQSTAQIQIADDDLGPNVTINDPSQAEGTGGASNIIFTVSLSAISGQPVDVTWLTGDGTATTPADYTGTSGTLTIPAGQPSGQIVVALNPDAGFEPDETFVVNLTGATNATVTDAQGIGTIVNDDGIPTITINDITPAEGTGGMTNFTFTVSLSAPSLVPISVTYATADGTATAPSDYTAIGPTVLTFLPGDQSETITVSVAGDSTVEPDETFFVNLSNATGGALITDNQGSARIVNDDAAASANLGISKVASSPTFAQGQPITFTITVVNTGPDAATNLEITDVLPPGLTFQSASTPGGNCTGTATVTCTVPLLNSGASAVVTLVTTAHGGAPIVNTATVLATQIDPNGTNNSGGATITPAAVGNAGIPTLSEWALMLMAAMLAFAAVLKLRM